MEGEKWKGLESLAETIIVIAFFAAILLLGPGAASEHLLKHDYPVGYGASDSFQHQTRSEAIKEMGQYRIEAPYMMAGLKVIGFYPPLLYHDTVLLSHLSGLETYDALFLLIGLALAMAAIAVYYLTKASSRHAAMLAMPLTLLITTGKPFLGLVTFGQTPVALSSLFLVAAAWAITRLNLTRSFILIGIFISGTIMTHTSEALFLAMFLAAALGLALANAILAKDRLGRLKAFLHENRAILAGGALAAAGTSYFLPIFFGIWPKMQPYSFKIETSSASFPAATLYPSDLGFMRFVIAIGIIAAALYAVQKRKELIRLIASTKLFALAFSFFMLLAGFGTYAGFGLRSFQTRLFWPVTLAPLAGFGLYQLSRVALSPIKASAAAKGAITLAAAVGVTAALSIAILVMSYSSPSTGSMDNDHWEAMRWIAENTPKDTTVYVPFSYTYSQTSMLYNTERVNYFLEYSEFVKLITSLAEKRSFVRKTLVSVAADSGAGFPYRTGLFSFGQQTSESPLVIDMCSADYYLIDIAFPKQAEQLAQASLYLQQSFLKANMTVEYQNQWVSVIKNNNRGGDCIG